MSDVALSLSDASSSMWIQNDFVTFFTKKPFAAGDSQQYFAEVQQ